MIEVASHPASGRAPRAPVRAAAPLLSIVALGTSLTARGGWTDALTVALDREYGQAVRMTIVARPGATSRWILGQLDRVVAERPDVVLLEAAANDASLLKGLALARSRAMLRAILEALRDACPAARLIVMTMNPAHGLRRMVRPRLNGFHEAHLAEAANLGALPLDCRPAWQALPRADRKTAIPDGLHPLPEAAAEMTVPLLLAALHTRAGRTA